MAAGARIKNPRIFIGKGEAVATEPKIAGGAARAAGAGILAERERAEGEQVELFPVPVVDPKGDIERTAAPVRKVGRPEGASSKATVALRDYLLRRGVLPQQAVMQFVALGPVGFAKAMGDEAERLERERLEAAGLAYPAREPVFTPGFMIEATKVWAKMAADLGRYFMAPQAPADAEGKALPTFFVSIGGQGSGVIGADGVERPPWSYIDIDENQQLSDGAPAQSQEDESQE